MDLRPPHVLGLRLLGPFEARVGGTVIGAGTRNGKSILAYLARRPSIAIPRETLCGLLWADSGDEQARASLRTALSALRKALGSAGNALEADSSGLRLVADCTSVDADTFGRSVRDAGDAETLTIAATLYSGAFLEGFGPVTPEFDRWVDAERAVLRSQYLALLLRLADAQSAAGLTEEAIATNQRLLAEDPLQEHVHRRLIRAYFDQRHYDAALKQFDRLKDLLQEELGVLPESPTLELIRDVRRARSSRTQISPVPRPLTSAQSEITVQEAHTAPGRPSLAVLPFRSLSQDTDAGYFAEGIAEDVIVELARNADLMVVARQSSFRFNEDEDTPEDIGRKLGVRFLLGGSVRLADARVRVTAHLIRCSDQSEVWAERYDRDLADIFNIQSEIARTVTGAVVGRISDVEAKAALARPEEVLEEYPLVMRGLRHMNNPEVTEFQRAIDCFSRATVASPQSARAWSLLALSRIYMRWYFELDDDMADIVPIADRAIGLDPRERRAHCALGITYLLRADHDRAANHFEAGLSANPNDDLLLTEYGRFLMYDDRPEEGLMRIREGMRLNPYHPNWYWGMQGRCLHTLGRFAEARDAFLRIRNPPYYTYAYLAACNAALGDREAARAAHAALYHLRPDFDLEAFGRIFPYRNPKTAEHFLKTLVDAGLHRPPD